MADAKRLRWHVVNWVVFVGFWGSILLGVIWAANKDAELREQSKVVPSGPGYSIPERYRYRDEYNPSRCEDVPPEEVYSCIDRETP